MNSGHDTMLTLATLVILPSGTRLYVIECSMTQMNLRRAQTENAAAPTTRGFARSFTEGNIKGGLGAVGKFALESNQGESEAMRNSSNINMVWYHTTIPYYGTSAHISSCFLTKTEPYLPLRSSGPRGAELNKHKTMSDRVKGR